MLLVLAGTKQQLSWCSEDTKRIIQTGFGVTKSQLSGAGNVAQTFCTCDFFLQWEWSWCSCGPLHVCISSGGEGTFLGGSPGQRAPTWVGVLADQPGHCLPSSGLFEVLAAAPPLSPIKFKLWLSTSPAAARKRRQVEPSYCLNYTNMKIHESHREPAFPLLHKMGLWPY